MFRVVLLCAMLAALGYPVLAAEGCLSCPAGGQVAPLAVAPVMLQPPMCGIVTLVGDDGQFAINLGSDAQLQQGAELLLTRCGAFLGRARVTRVNWLDAVAQLLPECNTVRLQAGDTVTVQFNPLPSKPPRKVPWFQPEGIDRETETLYTILTVVGIGLIIFD